MDAERYKTLKKILGAWGSAFEENVYAELGIDKPSARPA
jgi:hypothetical protein